MYVIEIFYTDGSKYLYGPFENRQKAIDAGEKLKNAKVSMVSSYHARPVSSYN